MGPWIWITKPFDGPMTMSEPYEDVETASYALMDVLANVLDNFQYCGVYTVKDAVAIAARHAKGTPQ